MSELFCLLVAFLRISGNHYHDDVFEASYIQVLACLQLFYTLTQSAAWNQSVWVLISNVARQDARLERALSILLVLRLIRMRAEYVL